MKGNLLPSALSSGSPADSSGHLLLDFSHCSPEHSGGEEKYDIQQSRRKYDGEYTPDVSLDKDAILSLGKLAFHQLERNNLIFYDSDLEACGLD
ncbi:NLR family CARD domain-containing protein 3-like, partial [Pimephales promelas]